MSYGNWYVMEHRTAGQTSDEGTSFSADVSNAYGVNRYRLIYSLTRHFKIEDRLDEVE